MKRVLETQEYGVKKRRIDRYFPNVICSLILSFALTMDDYLNLLRVSKNFYFMGGGIVNVLTSALLYNNTKAIQNASRCDRIDTWLHPLQWNHMVQKIPNALSNVNEMIYNQFREDHHFLWHNLRRGNRDHSDFWHDRCIAGGFVRSLCVRAFAKLGLFSHLQISAKYNDVDIFIKTDVGDMESHNQSFLNYICDEKKDDEKYNVCTFTVQKSSLFGDERVQHIWPSRFFEQFTQKSKYHIIEGFDLTCTQVAMDSSFWDGSMQIYTTPGFLYSLFTGKFFLNYCTEIPWPPSWFSGNDEYTSELTLCKNMMMSFTQEVRFARRILKYVALGYTYLSSLTTGVIDIKLLEKKIIQLNFNDQPDEYPGPPPFFEHKETFFRSRLF